MTKKKTVAPSWRLDHAVRADSGGKLWNAFHRASGREYYGVPSYDREAMQRRVDFLNESNAKLYRGSAANPYRILALIQQQLDGEEWNSDTTQAIAEIMWDAGYQTREPS